MAFEITIPRLGWSMEEGTFVRWLKQDGELVKPGDALFELEGEKAAQDIEAVDGGLLQIPPTAPAPGTVVPVGLVIGYLLATGETDPTVTSKAPRTIDSKSKSANVPPQTSPGASADSRPSAGTNAPRDVAASPSVRRMARERGISLSVLAENGLAGRILASDLNSPAATAVRTMGVPATGVKTAMAVSNVASPRARRVARELGIDWTQLSGTGRAGRVREQDVQNAATSKPCGPVPSQAATITRHRRTIADRMMHSHLGTAPVTLTTRIDATNLVGLRQQFKTASQVVPSYTDIVIKLIATLLPDHPLLMSQWSDDQIITPSSINIGIAVDTEAGLVVPVLRDVPAQSLLDVALTSSQLIARARQSQLKGTELQGGVFTVTNLGSFGIDAFTPILNSPESAILGLGRIRREPAVVGNRVVPRDQMTLSLTFDHRIVDGAPAARFLQSVAGAMEAPSAWLLKNQA